MNVQAMCLSSFLLKLLRLLLTIFVYSGTRRLSKIYILYVRTYIHAVYIIHVAMHTV